MVVHPIVSIAVVGAATLVLVHGRVPAVMDGEGRSSRRQRER